MSDKKSYWASVPKHERYVGIGTLAFIMLPIAVGLYYDGGHRKPSLQKTVAEMAKNFSSLDPATQQELKLGKPIIIKPDWKFGRLDWNTYSLQLVSKKVAAQYGIKTDPCGSLSAFASSYPSAPLTDAVPLPCAPNSQAREQSRSWELAQ